MASLKNAKRLVLLALALSVAALMFAAGCSQSQSSGSQSSDAQEKASLDADAGINKQDLEGLRVASMKGPTSVGLAYLMEKEYIGYEVVASADQVTPLLLQDKVDIACVPANVAAMLYSKTDGDIRCLDINTLGVLSVVTADTSIDSVEKLVGHTIYMTGKDAIPQYTIDGLLQAYGISPSEMVFEFKSEPSEVAAIVTSDHSAIGILPQPYATAATLKDSDVKETVDLSKAWLDKVGSDEGDLVTGVAIANASFVDANPNVVNSFLSAVQVSTQVAVEAPDSIAQTIVDLGIIDSYDVAVKAIPKCNVVCMTGSEMKDALNGYLLMLYGQNPESIGGVLPNDDFYYTAV